MPLWFGKKKEKIPEVAAPVGKTPPAAVTPPKVQTPPANAPFPTIKPPQPTGLMPSSIAAGGVATTQPMAVPRTGATGLRPTKPTPGQGTRSTQRIVLPTPPGARADSTRPLTAPALSGKISLPAGMVLRCMPPEVLATDIAELERSGAAATEVGLPTSMILGQLPSGKVEMTVQDLVPHIPPGFLQGAEGMSPYLQTMVSLPLMDVVMRIPPDLLALRPDQKEVDAAVINMADPFSEEALREEAENARRQAGANIIEESQAPQEEFVPSGGARSVAPPRRPAVEPLIPSRTAATTLAAPTIPTVRSTPPGLAASRPATTFAAPPLPPAATIPGLPATSARTPTGQIPTPTRMSAPLPPRQLSANSSFVTPPAAPSAPVPPVPRSTGPIPAPPPPRHTTTLPTAAKRTASLSSLSQSLSGAAKAAAAAAAASGAAAAGLIVEQAVTHATEPAAPAPAPEAEPETPAVPAAPADENKDDLQRLAALAMAQLGESADEEAPAEAASEAPAESPVEAPAAGPVPVTSFSPAQNASTVPVRLFPGSVAPVVPAAQPEPEPEVTAPEPAAMEAAPEAEAEVAAAPEENHAAEAEPASAVAEPIRAPEPEPAAPKPEPIRAPEPIAAVPEPIRAPEPVRATPPIRDFEPIRAPQPEAAPTDTAPASVAFNLNTCTAEDLVQNIVGISPVLAAAIIAHRQKIGSFSKLDELFNVPGMNREAYTNLTGEAPAEKPQQSLNDLLGFPADMQLSLKDVTDRISCWPDVTGCLLSQSTGLSLVGNAAPGLEKEAVVAFAPRMFEAINKSYSEVTGEETDVIIIPANRTSFHLFRSRDLYLIIMTRLPLMPERHVKVAKLALNALSNRKD